MKKLALSICLIITTSITAVCQYKYDSISTERFIHSIREHRVIAGIDEIFIKKINTSKLDTTWTVFIEDSIQVSDEIELPVLYGVDATQMNRVVSEAYANEMFNKLIENNLKFKEFCSELSLPKSLIICKTRYTSSDSYYVFTILTK